MASSLYQNVSQIRLYLVAFIQVFREFRKTLFVRLEHNYHHL